MNLVLAVPAVSCQRFDDTGKNRLTVFLPSLSCHTLEIFSLKKTKEINTPPKQQQSYAGHRNKLN